MRPSAAKKNTALWILCVLGLSALLLLCGAAVWIFTKVLAPREAAPIQSDLRQRLETLVETNWNDQGLAEMTFQIAVPLEEIGARVEVWESQVKSLGGVMTSQPLENGGRRLWIRVRTAQLNLLRAQVPRASEDTQKAPEADLFAENLSLDSEPVAVLPPKEDDTVFVEILLHPTATP